MVRAAPPPSAQMVAPATNAVGVAAAAVRAMRAVNRHKGLRHGVTVVLKVSLVTRHVAHHRVIEMVHVTALGVDNPIHFEPALMP